MKYKVIALNLTLANGRTRYAKEELTEIELGGKLKAEKLVEAGFLKAINKTVVKKQTKKSK